MNMMTKPEAVLLDDDIQMRGRHRVHIDRSRDCLLTDFGRATLDDRYLLPGESYQDLFARVAPITATTPPTPSGSTTISSKMWFMPATPVLSNGGTDRGLPISCFLNEATTAWKASSISGTRTSGWPRKGGGIGSYWGNLRSIGEKVGETARPPASCPSSASWTADPRDPPGLAAPRLGGGLSAGQSSRDRGIHRNPPPDRRRSEPQGAQPASRHPGLRRFHARGRKGREWALTSPEGRQP